MNAPSAPFRSSVAALAGRITLVTGCRLLINTTRRFAYPFAPVLARGLGVPLTDITSLIAVNQATGILSVVFGPVADRFGYRRMMLLGLGMLAAGMLAAGVAPYYLVVMAALFLAGLGKNIFDPALQAYVGARVPFERRGAVIGILEVAWAGSSLVGIPLVGLLIDRMGWRSPFWVLGGLAVLGLASLFWALQDGENYESRPKPAFRALWSRLFRDRAALGALWYGFWFSAANDTLFVVYGAWWEKSFQLSVVTLGLGTMVIGVAELLGEFCSAGLADRLGLKKGVLVGVLVTSACYLLLPLGGGSFLMAAGGVFFLFLAFEFTVVTGLSLTTELLPDSRATMMSGFMAAAGLGRVAGALAGGYAWQAGGILAVGVASAVMSLVAGLGLFWGLWTWSRPMGDHGA